MGILISWLVLSIAVWITAVVLPGVHIKGAGSAIVVAALFGVLNFFLGWFFIVVIGFATLGIGFLLIFITRWIVNAIILKIVDATTDRIKIEGFGWALGAALMISVVGTGAEWLLRLGGVV